MLHDVVARAMNEAGISFTLPDFHMLGNLRVKPEKWTIWIIKIMLSEDRIFNDSRNLNPDGFGNEGGDRQCIQKQSIWPRADKYEIRLQAQIKI
jgi:hypothetical protein